MKGVKIMEVMIVTYNELKVNYGKSVIHEGFMTGVHHSKGKKNRILLVQNMWKYFSDDSAWKILNENIEKHKLKEFDRICIYVGDLKDLRRPGKKENFVYHAMSKAVENIKNGVKIDLLCCVHSEGFLRDYRWMNGYHVGEWSKIFREIRVGCTAIAEINEVIKRLLSDLSIEEYLSEKIIG